MNEARPGALLCASIFALAVAAADTSPAAAASGGLAFDSVLKFARGDGSSAEPGTFAADFATASQPASSAAPKGVPFGFGKMVAQAQTMGAMFKNGVAEHHYVAGARERIDQIALGRAEIVDCASRTITTLDLPGKRYAVASLDQPVSSAGGAAKGAPAPAATDDGTKVALTLTNAALGAKTIDGTAADGFSSKLHFVTTKPSGETTTSDMTMTAYYGPNARPVPTCSHAAANASAGMGAMAAAMDNYRLAQRAMLARADARFTMTSNGPALPLARLPLFETVTFAGERGSGTMITERGNVHAIAEGDAAFSVPADFTKVDSL